MDNYRLVARRLFSDWQMPDFLPEVYLDVEVFVEQMLRIGAKSIDFCSKSAFGNCLYPSEVGFPNRAIKGDGDIFGKLCKLANSNGIEVFAYYNMLLDDKMGNVHPEWMQIDRHGTALLFENYKMFCMNSPYREHAFAHMEEIARLYPIDGFNLDIQYFHGSGCFCKWCKEQFNNDFGYELDVDNFHDNQNWVDLHNFQRKSRKSFIWTAVDRAMAVRENLRWYWNHSGFFNDDYELDSRATILATEVHPPDYSGSLAKAKWIQSSGKPIMFYMPESIGSWGHWSITTPATLKGMVALALAHGGAVTCNHVAPPCGDYAGKVSGAVYELLEEVMSFIGEREDLCLEKSTVPVTAVLHSADCIALADALRLASENGSAILDDKALGYTNALLASEVMASAQIPFDFLYNEYSLDRLSQYEALILPNVGYVNSELAAKLRNYVEAGGVLLATYNTSLLDHKAENMPTFELADLFGVDFERFSEYSLTYLDQFAPELAEGVPDMPLLIKDAGYQQNSLHRPIYCNLRAGARVLARFTEPILESDWSNGQHIYHDHAPPGKRTDWPAVIANNYGKGTCFFLPLPFLQAYGQQPNPWYRQLIKNILHTAGVPGKINYRANQSIKLTATQDQNGWLIHLIKLQKETDSMFLDSQIPSGPVQLAIKPPWPVQRVFDAVKQENIDFQTKEGTVSFQVDNVEDYTIVRVQKA